MTKKTLTALIAAFALLGLSGCGTSAALVRKDGTGGRIELRGAYMPAMFEARELMVDHCYGRYDMLELGEALEFRCRRAHAAEPQANGLAIRETARLRRGL